jgi:hypothetical protein
MLIAMDFDGVVVDGVDECMLIHGMYYMTDLSVILTKMYFKTSHA